MPNFIISSQALSLSTYQVFEIDGNKAITLRGFYEEIARVLHFPEYFGFNLDSFDEMLNDLSWLDAKKIAIFIRNSEQFISKERNPDKLPTLLDLLDATCEDWKWVDESEDFEPKELTIVFTPSERIQTLLEQQEIYFEKID